MLYAWLGTRFFGLTRGWWLLIAAGVLVAAVVGLR